MYEYMTVFRFTIHLETEIATRSMNEGIQEGGTVIYFPFNYEYHGGRQTIQVGKEFSEIVLGCGQNDNTSLT